MLTAEFTQMCDGVMTILMWMESVWANELCQKILIGRRDKIELRILPKILVILIHGLRKFLLVVLDVSKSKRSGDRFPRLIRISGRNSPENYI